MIRSVLYRPWDFISSIVCEIWFLKSASITNGDYAELDREKTNSLTADCTDDADKKAKRDREIRYPIQFVYIRVIHGSPKNLAKTACRGNNILDSPVYVDKLVA